MPVIQTRFPFIIPVHLNLYKSTLLSYFAAYPYYKYDLQESKENVMSDCGENGSESYEYCRLKYSEVLLYGEFTSLIKDVM